MMNDKEKQAVQIAIDISIEDIKQLKKDIKAHDGQQHFLETMKEIDRRILLLKNVVL